MNTLFRDALSSCFGRIANSASKLTLSNIRFLVKQSFVRDFKGGLSPDKEGATHLFLFLEMLDRFWA